MNCNYNMNYINMIKRIGLGLFWLACAASLAPAVRVEASPWPFLKDVRVGAGVLDVGLGLRLRYEALDGFTVKGYKPQGGDRVLLGRLRVNCRYSLDLGPSFFIQLQDARFRFSDLSDDPADKSPYQNYLDLRQAYVEWRMIAGSPLSLKLGRQTASYGDYHIFGPADWGNVGRYTWDLAKVLGRWGDLQLDAFGGRQVWYHKDEFDDEYHDFQVQALYGQWDYLPGHGLDVFYVRKYDGSQAAKGESGWGGLLVNTVGLYAAGAWKCIDYKATYARQFGDYGQDRIEAWGLSLLGGCTLPLRFSPRVSLGFTQGSGDGDPGDGVHGVFDGVFGAVDKYYGRMNLFCWSNLEDLQLGFSLKPLSKVKVSLTGHLFRLSQAKDAWYYANGKKMRRDPSGGSGRDLGRELDLIVSCQARKNLEIKAGLCGFWAEEFIDNTGPSGDAFWAFLQVALKY